MCFGGSLLFLILSYKRRTSKLKSIFPPVVFLLNANKSEHSLNILTNFLNITFFTFRSLKMNSTQMLNNSNEGLSISTADAYARAREVIYGVIAALSFLLNFLFAVIMIRKPAMLKRPHNILLFSLAITDLLTGW